MQKITPFLWFDNNAEEAVNFYLSIFQNSRILQIASYGEASAAASGRPKGTVMTLVFELEGQPFIVLNGGPMFTFSPAVSFVVNCRTQKEIDLLWEKLSEGGQPQQCGWLQDRYGLSWQIVPAVLGELLQNQDVVRAERVMAALMRMTKIDIDTLNRAAEAA